MLFVEGGHPIVIEEFVDEVSVLTRNHFAEFGNGHSALVGAGVLRWHDEVDAVRKIANLFFDPIEVDLELLI